MYINSLCFEDQLLKITVEKVNFRELNLLVGASGAGKTMIINVISNLKQITLGNSGFPGVVWELDFTTTAGKKVVWSGSTEKTTLPAKIANDLNGNKNNIFENETLIVDGKKYAERKKENLQIGEKSYSINPGESLLFNSTDFVLKEIAAEFRKIVFSDNSPQYDFNKGKFTISGSVYGSDKKYTLKQIKNSNLSTPDKLYLTFKFAPETFENIKERFIEIFDFVENIKIAPYEFLNSELKESLPNTRPVVQIKEKYSDEWVHEIYISSGMSRTLLKLAEIELAVDHSIIIIDELENSLGANSLEVLVDEIKYSEADIQFIITSHHPYIIQNIEPDTWRLVKRVKNKIITLGAENIGIGMSKHDRFFELLNTDEFRTGIVK